MDVITLATGSNNHHQRYNIKKLITDECDLHFAGGSNQIFQPFPLLNHFEYIRYTYRIESFDYSDDISKKLKKSHLDKKYPKYCTFIYASHLKFNTLHLIGVKYKVYGELVRYNRLFILTKRKTTNILRHEDNGFDLAHQR